MSVLSVLGLTHPVSGLVAHSPTPPSIRCQYIASGCPARPARHCSLSGHLIESRSEPSCESTQTESERAGQLPVAKVLCPCACRHTMIKGTAFTTLHATKGPRRVLSSFVAFSFINHEDAVSGPLVIAIEAAQFSEGHSATEEQGDI